MSGHRTQTTVDHWIDLNEQEMFRAQVGLSERQMRVEHLHCKVIDGSPSGFVVLSGHNILKTGDYGAPVTRSFWWSRAPAAVLNALRARGVRVPDGAA